jgi:uncharacterized integral membrane protein
MTSTAGDSGSTSGSTGSRASPGRRPNLGGRSRGEQLRLGLAAVLGGLAVAFALLNLNRVDVDWILGTWNTPLILVIAVSLLVGALLGTVIGRRRSRTPSGSAAAAHSDRGT